MPVYVDNARIPYRRMKMCHMIADTLGELHAMADTIGVDRRHFQNQPGRPHYDICLRKRAAAIEAGAQPVTSKRLVKTLMKVYG